MKYKIIKFMKNQTVFVIALFAAFITMFIIPPNAGYLDYINANVLVQLFCLMASIGGIRSLGVFELIADFLLQKAGNLRKLSFVFLLVCFFSSMLVTNDVALLTFVPLTLIVYEKIPDETSRILTIVLETAGANLGSMMTPFGNPQNLYLYDKYQLTTGDFLLTMLPAGTASLVMLTLLCFLLPADACMTGNSEKSGNFKKIKKSPLIVYLLLFGLCLLTVFRVVPMWICLLATIIFVPFRQLAKVDYGLLGTFLCFFVFVGNIAQIESVSRFFSEMLSGREILIAVLLSQIISNVPASVMLSGFTDHGTALLLGVNLGGLGTMIASLASLISFQFYKNAEKAESGKYLLVFSLVNFGMLVVLLALAFL
ncbi:MAG: citrate transporter [Oscillospiraceae bacterium]|nr:citrate transporter [Oscillospiraceae bacterium]